MVETGNFYIKLFMSIYTRENSSFFGGTLPSLLLDTIDKSVSIFFMSFFFFFIIETKLKQQISLNTEEKHCHTHV